MTASTAPFVAPSATTRNWTWWSPHVRRRVGRLQYRLGRRSESLRRVRAGGHLSRVSRSAPVDDPGGAVDVARCASAACSTPMSCRCRIGQSRLAYRAYRRSFDLHQEDSATTTRTSLHADRRHPVGRAVSRHRPHDAALATMSGTQCRPPPSDATVKILRTPIARFANLAGYPFDAQRTPTIRTADGSDLRIARTSTKARRIWSARSCACTVSRSPSYLYRKMIPLLVGEGTRKVIAPDLPGYGKSDNAGGPGRLQLPATGRLDGALARAERLLGDHLLRPGLRADSWGCAWSWITRIVSDRVVVSNTGLPYNPDLPDEVVSEVERVPRGCSDAHPGSDAAER